MWPRALAAAVSRVTPARSLATTGRKLPRFGSSVLDNGVQNAAPLGKSKSGGMMPTTVCGTPLSTIERPTTPESAPK